MGIDFGMKRTGIAVTDELQIIASGLTTVETQDIFSFLDKYFKEEEVETVVVGLPKRMNNDDSLVEEHIQQFINRFKNSFPLIHLERQDERFTSKLAVKTMIDSGLNKKKRQNKALIDEISATIILQSYMERRRFI
ncbi:putative pre-16S rRNA nuclease [Flavobacteriaceae bacterium UJ101]|nr:putative pre-16S rRNA nuclease [Flavobacteriaceae bacterium UJ101]